MTKDNFTVEAIPIGTLESNMSLIVNKDTSEAVIIDPGNDFEMFSKIQSDYNFKVTKIIHTHGHFDHIGQAPTIQAKYGGELMLHKDDIMLFENMENSASMYGQSVAKPTTINSFFSDGEEISLWDELTLKVLHTPGHSLGSCCFYTTFFDTPILFSGDTLFQNSIGRTDLPGGNYDQLINSIKTKLLTLPDETICICGHGGQTTIGSERANNPFLSNN